MLEIRHFSKQQNVGSKYKIHVMFETNLSIKSFLLFSLPSIGISLIWVKVALSGDYGFGIFISICALLILCYSVKKIRLTENEIIIRRPLWILMKNRIYFLENIEKIKLIYETTRLGGGPKLIIVANKKQEDYLKYLSRNDLKELVRQLEIKNVKIEKDKYFEK